MINVIILTLYLLALVYTAHRICGSYVNPVTFFAGSWSLQALTVWAGPVLYDEVSLLTVAIVAAVHTIFFILFSITYYSLRHVHTGKSSDCDIVALPREKALFRMIIFMSIIGLYGILVTLNYLISSGDINIMLAEPYTFRDMCLKDEIEFPMISHVLTTFPVSALILSGFYLAYGFKKKWIVLLPIVIIFALSMIDAGKAMIVWCSSLMLCTYLYTKFIVLKQNITLVEIKKLAIIGCVFVAILMSISLYRLRLADDIVEYQKDIYDVPFKYGKDIKLLFPIVDVMNYISVPLPSLSIYLERPDIEMTGGVFTLKPIAKYMFGQDMDSHFDFVYTPMPSNIYTAIHEMQIDFGWSGMLLIFALLACIVAILFKRIHGEYRHISLILLSYLSTFLFYSVFLTITYSTKYWFSLILSLLIYPLIVKREHNAVTAN